ncbi:hypothetical protein A2630_00535 [Candidatus Woesebacteria bacterium RIFCSPHIGHO2_01_FULL_44_10]|uniref:N(4)-bis(aminopropyl)spermidine synthase C-terminal domain-containing protein n=1 Tax=Candidatus Woesebacteria bacterium RIFCSPLOWO2_01_FULL_44_14 TaxID=1802525 RepID=A0A1F8C2C8_9BACT|nr:MAG: hypothetical protein A2630_00535 [Candidatus Woesebacteria bacterium RIFCSPHIGHO2_01_FULL_44_10]OGM54387.1 MAG: hypothetical protein A3F62_01390 [Candidatus Woesebacteria bacterium RIFCSPHIGHO2_12_FULL_44_11]OGM70290.1 MAG: hypothetical protein A2975_04440 [Candidatus Woesebacteria bacterium RIFCSPLOWO2_01_FULL_44_14]
MSDKNMHERINQISKETGVPTKKVLDLLFALRDGEVVENNELVRKVGVSKNALNKVKERLASVLEPVSKDTQLDGDHVQEIRAIFDEGYKFEDAMWTILEDDKYKKASELLETISDKRPSPERRFDQFTATIETTARRASLLQFFGDIKGKRILFLGDDDFTSIGVASLGLAAHIEVLDVDKRILESIKGVAETEGFTISTTRSDLTQRLPNQLMRNFDIVFTDPPYTENGMNLFLSRAIQALDPDNHAARIYTCYGNSDRARERYLPVQRLFTESGLMMRWVFDGFNRYRGAESIGSSSALLIADVTPKTKPLVKGGYDKPIYTNN